MHTIQREVQTDPREQEDWFRRLPDKAKDEFRERFRQEGRSPVSAMQHRERMIQCFIDASIVYLPAEFLFFGLSFWSFLVVSVMSVVLGLLWFHTSASRTLIVIAGIVVIRVLCGFTSPYFVVLSAMVSVGIAMATTLTREAGRAL